MEMKRNDATLNRPEGDRVIDALYVFIDLPHYIRQLKEEPAWQKNDRNGITVFKTDNLSMVLTVLHDRAVIRDNRIEGIVTLQVIEGMLRINTIDGDIDMKEKQLINLHSNERHSIEAVGDAAFLLSHYSGLESL